MANFFLVGTTSQQQQILVFWHGVGIVHWPALLWAGPVRLSLSVRINPIFQLWEQCFFLTIN